MDQTLTTGRPHNYQIKDPINIIHNVVHWYLSGLLEHPYRDTQIEGMKLKATAFVFSKLTAQNVRKLRCSTRMIQRTLHTKTYPKDKLKSSGKCNFPKSDLTANQLFKCFRFVGVKCHVTLLIRTMFERFFTRFAIPLKSNAKLQFR